MKKFTTIAASIVAMLSLASCESFFSVDLKEQANMDEVFSQSTTTHRYLAHLYSYIPLDEEIVGSAGWVCSRSDEALYSWYQWVYYLNYRTGNYGSSTPVSTTYFNYWEQLYMGINQCSIFMTHVDQDKDDSPQIVECMKAEARFLRAYFYFCLFRQYGPVIIWGDKLSNEAVVPAQLDRNTVDENINFIVDQLNKAIEVLPMNICDIGESDNWTGRATKAAAMALKSRVLLYAASPLYNGCELYQGQMKNLYGNYLFPQEPDPKKWEAAAQAAKDVIDLNAFELTRVQTTGDAFKDGGASYQAAFFENWNSETIWGWWRRTSSAYSWMGGGGAILATSCPPLNGVIYQGYGGICPSLKMVDTFPMWESGRYPVKKYQKDGVFNNYSRPIIDEKSGYVAEGWQEGYKQPLDADWAPAFKAHKSCVGRDPRFYACIVPNGFYWPNQTERVRFTCYNNKECTAPWQASGEAVRVGYTWRKWYTPNRSLRLATDYPSYKVVYPAFRLAEIYLNYAEACNEKSNRNVTDALLYLNKVRNRVGLNNIEDAYPEVNFAQDKEFLAWCIQKERMVEFGMEAMRHYDACRWMVAKDEYPCQNWTLHVSANTYEESYERVCTDFVGGDATFTDRDYLFPISVNQLREMPNVTQNYGF